MFIFEVRAIEEREKWSSSIVRTLNINIPFIESVNGNKWALQIDLLPTVWLHSSFSRSYCIDIAKVMSSNRVEATWICQVSINSDNCLNCPNRAVFNWVSKLISELLWFIIASLSDWFKVLASIFQPIRSETKTNHGSRVHIFPRFVSATQISLS